MRPASPEDRQRIVDLYKGGMTRPAIARETGWSEGTVHNIIKAAGVQGAGRVTGIRTDPDTEAQIMALYAQGVPWREIQRITGRTEHTLSAIIKRNGGELDRKGEVTPAARARIPVLYESGMDAPAIGHLLGCHSSSIYNVLRDAGVDRRVRGCDNADYFDQIDTPEKAYWLGFIAADGCVTGFESGNRRLQIKLARKDRDHLVLLHKALKASRPIRDTEEVTLGERRPYSVLAVYSPQIADALVRCGITPRKSHTLQPWDGPAALMPHYWRGLVDGDGSITINDSGVFLSFVGSEAVVRGFRAWAGGVCGTASAARHVTTGAADYWVIQVGGTVRILRLLAALYDDAPVALARKKALADLAVHGKPLQAAMF
jgi:Homeodomain-like domain